MSEYAMKQMKRNPVMGNANAGAELELMKEIDIQDALAGHENIVQLFEVLDDKNEEKIYLIMEDCKEGQLLTFNDETSPQFVPNPVLAESGELSEATLKTIAR